MSGSGSYQEKLSKIKANWRGSVKRLTVDCGASSSTGSSERPNCILQVKREGGLFLKCKLFGQPVSFLVDSGASCSLIDVNIYMSLCSDRQIPLSEIKESFVLADGSELAVFGEIEVNLRVGQRVFPQSVVVADLGGEGAILGLDFMRKYRAVLRPYTGQMNLGRETVQLYREKGRQRCSRVSLGGSLTIQPCSV